MTINNNELSLLLTVLTVNVENAKTLFLLTHTSLVAFFLSHYSQFSSEKQQ